MKRIRKKTILRTFILILIAALFALGLFAVSRYFGLGDAEVSSSAEAEADPYADDDDVARIFYQGAWYRQKKNCRTFLLIGVDDQGEQKDYGSNINHAQADFLMLFIIDDDKETYSALQLNRDTMTEIVILGAFGDRLGQEVAQLALAHTYGSGLNDSCELTMDAVSGLLFGTRVDHYAALSMDAIGIMNDQVGGVTVTVPVDLTSEDPALREGASVTLNADQAEIFVRARRGLEDPTNLARMDRQRVFLDAWKETALSRAQSDGNFVLDLAMSLSDYLVSDMTVNQLSDFANALIEYQDQGVQVTRGNNVVGDEFMEFYVDQQALQAQVVELFYEKDESFQPG